MYFVEVDKGVYVGSNDLSKLDQYMVYALKSDSIKDRIVYSAEILNMVKVNKIKKVFVAE